MKSSIVYLLILLTCSTIYGAIIYTGPKIFYTNSQKHSLVGTEPLAIPVTGCSCVEFTLVGCNATKVADKITINLEIPTTNYGFCDLRIQPNNVAFAKVAFLDELSLSPPLGNSVGNTMLSLTSTPSLDESKFAMILTSPSITLFYEPNQKLITSSTSTYNLTSQVKNSAKTYSSSTSNNEWDVEFVLEDTYNSVTQKYPISQPFVIYVDSSVNFTSVTPKLVTVGHQTKITISGANFVSGKATVDIKFGNTEITGSVIDSTTIEVEYTFPIGTVDQDVPIQVSFDSKNTWQTTNLNLRTLQYPSALAVTYLPATFPEEVGCSVVGFNNFSLNIFNEIPSNLKGSIELEIYDFTFSKKVSCSYESNKIVCPCPAIYELSIILPHSYKFKLKLNGIDSVTTQLATSKPVISYFKPNAFSFSPLGKFASEPATPLIFSGLQNLYSMNFTYAWYLRNKESGTNVKISPNCLVNTTTGVQFYCNDMSFLISTNTNELPGTKTDNGKITIETVCGCKFVDLSASSTICPTDTYVVNGQCCQNVTITTNTTIGINGTMNGNSTVNSTIVTNTTITGNVTCFTPCTKSCELYPVLKIGNNEDNSGGFESPVPFHFYPKIRISTIVPNAVVLSSQRNITITGGPFVENAIKIEFRPLLNDPYEQSSTNQTHPKEMPTQINFINTSCISIINPIISNDVGYEIFLTNHASSYASVSNHFFRSYNISRTSFKKISGDQGNARSTPGGSKINIEGEGFFPSSLIKVKYTSGVLTFENTCTFIDATNITCKTNDVYSTGITLPKDFTVTFSMNGFDYIDTGLSLTFLESEVPVIVQVVPAKGPMKPDTPYSLFIKGITKNIDRCVWTSKTNAKVYYTTPPALSDTEIRCPVPTDQITGFEATDFGIWKLNLLSTITDQVSPTVDITLYPNPTIQRISPTFGTAFGGTPIEIFGSGFTLPGSGLDLKAYKMTFKLTETRSPFDCVIHNDTYSVCIAPSHPEDKDAAISISFNENDFFKWQGVGSGTYEVQSCDKGLAGKDFEAPCVPCVAGMFKPLRGFFDCIKCTANTYQPEPRKEICLQCPPRTISIPGSINITDCDCEPQTWRKPNTTSGTECEVCVPGGRCDGGAGLPYPKVGYYWDRSNIETEPYKFVQCKVEEYCTGNTTNGQEGCIKGRTGLLCENCAAGYFKSSGNCELCNTEVQWRMIVVVTFLVVLILLFFKFAQLKVSHLNSFSIASSYYQIIAVFSAYNFKWPAGLKSVLGYLKFLNLDLDIFVPECISIITYAMKWAATICLPIMFGSLLFLGFLLEVLRSLLAKLWGPFLRRALKRFYHVNRQNWLTKQYSLTVIAAIEFFAAPKTMKEISEFGDKCIHTFVIVLSFSYVFVVTKASQIFNCTEIQGVLRMDSERTVICFQNDWWAYLPFAIITLLTFGLGVLILFAYVLLFKKRILADKRFNARFRFLFVRFRDERLYWEIIIIVRKLFISTAVIFFAGYPMLVILFSMFIIFSAFILQSHHTPYRRKFHNLMEYIVLLSTEVLLFCALLFYVDDFPDAWNKELLGFLCIMTIVITSIVIGIIVVTDFGLQWSEDRQEAIKHRKMLELDANYGNDMDVNLDQYDTELAKFGLKRRLNQSTVIVDQYGKEILKTNDTVMQSMEGEEKKNEVSVQIKGGDVELQDVDREENVNSNPSFRTTTMTSIPSDSKLLPNGISELPERDIELSDVELTRENEIEESRETGIAEVEDEE